MICCINGKFIPEKNAKISILDHGFLYSDGFYDTMKSFEGTILDLEVHLKRIENSMKTLALQLPWKIEKVKSWIEKMAQAHKSGLARVRVTITRGENDFDFNSCKKPTVTILAEPIYIDPKIYKNGVAVITLPMRRVLPEIKTIGVTGMTIARRVITQKKVFEALFTNDGFVREGSITNLFIVKKGAIYTPKTEILKGITRHEILEIAKKEALKIFEKDLTLKEVLTADEIFLSNTKFGVTPVVAVDGKKVGNGKVGPTTQKIMMLFNNFVEDYIQKHRPLTTRMALPSLR